MRKGRRRRRVAQRLLSLHRRLLPPAAGARCGIAASSSPSPHGRALGDPAVFAGKQEYIPSDVDEAEFEMQAKAPEGASLASMSDAMRAIEKTRADARRPHGADVVGGSMFSGTVTGQHLRPARPPRGADLLAPGLAPGLVSSPARGLPRQLPATVMQQIRAEQQVQEIAHLGPEHQAFNLGGGNRDIDFAIRGPNWRRWRSMPRRWQSSARARADGRGQHAEAGQARAARPIDRARAADLGVGRKTSPLRCG